jgi:hypothetical protein
MRRRRGRALWRRRSLGVPLRPGPRTLSGAAAGLSVICRSSPENPSVGDDPLERTAQCQCGSLRAVTSGEPLRVSVCHCITCQRRTGSVLSCNAYFQKSSVRIEGAAGLYARRAESGREVRNNFCPDCATTCTGRLMSLPICMEWQSVRSPIPHSLRRHSPSGRKPCTVGSTCRIRSTIQRPVRCRDDGDRPFKRFPCTSAPPARASRTSIFPAPSCA